MNIKLTLISDIYDFIDVAQKHASDVILSQGNYFVDGKSVLGVFALDLRRPIKCDVADRNYDDFERFVNKM
jgi:phosphotransferase system HPr-like phosphotransfer protein